jgi:hypothetical protein
LKAAVKARDFPGESGNNRKKHRKTWFIFSRVFADIYFSQLENFYVIKPSGIGLLPFASNVTSLKPA